jgi:ribose transport system ATP-binding protein
VTTEAQAGPALVAMTQIEKQYAAVRALAGVDFHVRAAESIGLVGKNGAGKSTLIKVLAGAVRPDSGQISIQGKQVNFRNPSDALQCGLAFVHQDLGIIKSLTAAENIFLASGYPKLGASIINRRRLRMDAVAALEPLVTLDRVSVSASELSPADQRMVMIAQALSTNPRLLVLDEPTTSFTADAASRLHSLMRELKTRGLAVMYVSHRLEEVLDVCDRIVVMRDGSCVADVGAAEVSKSDLIGLITGGAPAARASVSRKPAQVTADQPVFSLRDVTIGSKLQGVSLDLYPGEIVGLAGLVGSGRTTLAEGIAGLRNIDSGRLLVSGRSYRFRSPSDAQRAGIALAPEDRKRHGIIKGASLRRNLTLAALRRVRLRAHLPIPSRRRELNHTRRLIGDFKIVPPLPDNPAENLSGGNQQKLVLARIAFGGMRVLVLDEPTQGVDVEGKRQIYDLARQFAREGKALLIIASDFSELLENCDRLLVMSKGTVAATMNTTGLSEQEILEHCF